MNSDLIPYDLMIEIFSRLPSKSIARFHCVSKQWGSMFHHPDFTNLFLEFGSLAIMNSDFIPYDLMIDIFSRLPKKSIARFHCVSKQWGSMFHSQDFTKLFLARSSARPRLLFAVKGYNEWSFYSSPQRQNPYEKSSSSHEVVSNSG
ncbi:unnamed protein product [Microthlaspi erraticum]|uniref:F-box domain-containing protein n=1 Tax=Microthlaspi erraticum TaxID=1685480 RepID=A0A6D2K1I0_9BRAS|nr:unnamed protein product [Microthlaspi erraticum]